MRWFACLCSMFILLAGGETRGQSGVRAATESALPPDAGWSSVVAQFAQALVRNDPGAVAPLLSDAANIHTLGGRTSDALRLLASARQCELISARSYVHAPPTAAGDIAAAIRDASVPADVKEMMMPLDQAELRRANDTAARWLEEAVGARGGDRVAIVVLWSSDAAGSDTSNPTRGISFVLLKGTAAGSEAKIQTVVFGDPKAH